MQQKKARLPKPPVKRSAAGSDAEKVKENRKAGANCEKDADRQTQKENLYVQASRPISNDETAEISEKPEKRPVKKKKVRPASEGTLSTKTPGEKKGVRKETGQEVIPKKLLILPKFDEQKYGKYSLAEQVRTKREKGSTQRI